MKNKPIALLTAGVMLTVSASLLPVYSAEQQTTTKSTNAIAPPPDWLPSDFDSALKFRNTYGAIHIEDGLICAVFQEQLETVPEGEPRGVLRYDVNTTKGMTECMRHDIFASKDSAFNYEVIVYKPIMPGEFEITFSDTWVNVNGEKKYTFSIDDSLNSVETDIYSWLPDCYEEYRIYELMNRNVSVKDNYLVFCFDSTAGSAFDWYPTPSNDYDRSVIDYEMTEYCNEETPELLDGGEQHRIEVYQAKKDGMAKISYDYVANYGKPYLPEEAEETLVADCAILNNSKTILLPGHMRASIVDYDTDEIIDLTDGITPYIWTKISDGTVSTGPILTMETNPAIVSNDLGGLSDGKMSFGLEGRNLPDGYYFIDDERSTGYYSGMIIPENSMTVTRYDNGSADVVFRLKKTSKRVLPEEKSADLTNLKKGETRITFYDKDTGELIPSELMEHRYLGFGTDIRIRSNLSPDGWMYTGPVYTVNFNPCIYTDDNLAGLYRSADYFAFICDDQPEVTLYDNGAMDLVIRTKIKVSGNINGDSEFNIADLVALQKWLLNALDKELSNWVEADFDLDNKLTIFDLCIMRKELIKKLSTTYVKPDREILYGSPIQVVADQISMHLGPDKSYGVVTTIPQNTVLTELGVQDNNNNWAFVEYKGQYGWIEMVANNGETQFIINYPVPAKPVIYLYPEHETDVHVELELTEAELSTTYPKYNNGWDVTAYPDGTLMNKADGTHHRYLFWDAVNCRTEFDFSKGFCVAGSDTESFLKEKLTYMGLTEDEMNEFIIYWLPLMEHNKYNLVSFQGDVYTNSAKLNITPTPDSLLRVFMTYVPLDDAIDIEPQQLQTFERKGFTVVEWGGSEIES